MNIRLFDGPIATTPSLLDAVQRRVAHALRHVTRAVSEVEVRLFDSNAAKGGVDKVCRIVAHLPHAQPVVVEQRGADYYGVIDGAASRLKRAAEHRLSRRYQA